MSFMNNNTYKNDRSDLSVPFIPCQIPESLNHIPETDDGERISNVVNILYNGVHESLLMRGSYLISKPILTINEKYELSDISFTLMKIGGEMILCRVGSAETYQRLLVASNQYGTIAHKLLH